MRNKIDYKNLPEETVQVYDEGVITGVVIGACVGIALCLLILACLHFLNIVKFE